MIYFKNSGEKVSVRVRVRKILRFENLTPNKVRELLLKYGKDDGVTDIKKYFQLFKDKNYCLLIFINKPETIEPFDIDKRGFGSMAAWICMEDINSIRH